MSDRHGPLHLECPRCGHTQSEPGLGVGCPVCAREGIPANLTTVYDLDRARAAFAPDVLAARPSGHWRYSELLPVTADEAVTLGEGGTPLVQAPRLAEALGLTNLWIKDESRNPTWSFKDRAAATAVAHARALGSAGVVVASTGNAAAATAAYARRAGVPAVVLFARGVDAVMSALVRAYGAHVVATPTKADRWTLMRAAVERFGFYPNSNYADPPIGNTPYALDGYKTIGFEIWEQLGRRAPDWVILPAGYGDGLFGAYKAFSELEAMGLASVPKLGAGEIYGSLARAVAEGRDHVERGDADRPTAAFSIGTAQSAYQALHAVRRSGGWVEQVAEKELIRTQRLVAESEGVFPETASAVAFAALARLGADARVRADDVVVVVNTSAGVKSVGATPAGADVPVVEDLEQFTTSVEGLLDADTTEQRRRA